MLIEMHAHTSEHSSCSRISAVDLVRQILDRGLQGLVITDHHYHWTEKEIAALRKASAAPAHFLIFSGQEVSTPRFGDILVYGASQTIPPGIPVESISHDFPNAALVWAHPYRGAVTPSAEMLTSAMLNGVEIFNSNHTIRENRQALSDWHRHKFTAIAGTDTHAATYAGAYPTHFFHPVRTIEDLALEIKAGRCRPFFSEISRDGANTKVTEVAIGLSPQSGRSEHVIIKATETEEKWQAADRAFQIMKAFNEAGFSNETYRIPRTLDEDTNTHTLIEEFIEGASLFERLETATEEEGQTYMRLTAEWLARLHALGIGLNAPEDFAKKELQRLARYVEYFSAADHPHTRKAQETAEALAEEIGARLKSGGRFVQGHGDFHPKNIYIGHRPGGEPFVAAIDFDSSYNQPPAFDLGYFLAQFRTQFFNRPDICKRHPDEGFLAAYAGAGGISYHGFREEVSLFKARTNLNIASFFVWLGKGDDESVWRLLVEADQILTTECSSSS